MLTVYPCDYRPSDQQFPSSMLRGKLLNLPRPQPCSGRQYALISFRLCIRV